MLLSAVFFLFAAFLISCRVTKLLHDVLIRKNIFDIPNHRSSHQSPTPVGGGLAIILTFFLGCLPMLIIHGKFTRAPLILFAALATLCFISFRDDIKHVSIWLRLAVHIVAGVLAGFVVQDNGNISFGYLNPWLELGLIAFMIVGFINIFNFMDGIDGMAGVETIHLSISAALIFWLAEAQPEYVYVALLLGASTLGFLIHNWHPAKIFLGDTGSITIGFVLGLLLMLMAAKGYWLQALIVPMYYFLDAGFVLLKRAVKLEKIWLPHTQHFFQIAVRKGVSHSEIVIKVIICNLLLSLLSLVSLHYHTEAGYYKVMLLMGAICISACTIYMLPKQYSFLDIRRKS